MRSKSDKENELLPLPLASNFWRSPSSRNHHFWITIRIELLRVCVCACVIFAFACATNHCKMSSPQMKPFSSFCGNGKWLAFYGFCWFVLIVSPVPITVKWIFCQIPQIYCCHLGSDCDYNFMCTAFHSFSYVVQYLSSRHSDRFSVRMLQPRSKQGFGLNFCFHQRRRRLQFCFNPIFVFLLSALEMQLNWLAVVRSQWHFVMLLRDGKNHNHS